MALELERMTSSLMYALVTGDTSPNSMLAASRYQPWGNSMPTP